MSDPIEVVTSPVAPSCTCGPEEREDGSFGPSGCDYCDAREVISNLNRIRRWTQEASPVPADVKRLYSATDGKELMVITRRTVRDLCDTLEYLAEMLAAPAQG